MYNGFTTSMRDSGVLANLIKYVPKRVLCEQLKNSVALVRTRTIPTERPPPVGEVSANFCG